MQRNKLAETLETLKAADVEFQALVQAIVSETPERKAKIAARLAVTPQHVRAGLSTVAGRSTLCDRLRPRRRGVCRLARRRVSPSAAR